MILINMEMPVNCRTCRFHRQWDGDTELHCLVDGEIWQNFYEKNRHPDCPLIEVPPHGRLIDADDLRKKYFCGEYIRHDLITVPAENILYHIDIATTVIPADKDGEQ